MPGCREPLDESLRRVGVDIDEGDLGVLTGKSLHHGGADAGAAAGDEDDAVGETGIAGEDQRSLLRDWFTGRDRERMDGRQSDQPFALRVEQAGLAHVDGERDALAHRRRLVRLEARDDLALAEAHDDDGFRARRLDDFDRRFEEADLAAAAGAARIVPRDVLRPDAEDDAAAGVESADRYAVAAGPAGLSPPFATRRRRCPSAATISAGRKFIAGEPMKPATNMLAGRS